MWRTTLHLERADERLVSTCRAAGVTEVYLAVDARILADARLGPLLSALHEAGIRVYALMGDAAWYRAEARPRMHALIDAVGARNATAAAAARFDGVHFDIEPHQLPENKGTRAYLPSLAAALSEGRDRAAGFGLSADADLPRFAIEDAPELRPVFTRAVARIFLMLYELHDKSTEGLIHAARTTSNLAFAQAQPATRTCTMAIGVSVEDYTELSDLASKLSALDAEKPGNARYGGWAIHDERRLAARTQARVP